MEHKEETPDAPVKSLGDRMKAYESSHDPRLDASKPFIVRVDGKSFSSYTRDYEKPWDERVSDAMEAAAEALMKFFPACRTAYTQSDEITLVFGAFSAGDGKHIFDGRVIKISTIAASVASMTFYQAITDPDSFITDSKRARVCCFDGRAFDIDDECEAANNIVWRCAHDCVRNSRLKWGEQHLGRSKIKGLSCKAIVERVKAEKALDWADLPPRWKYGTTFKWETYWSEEKKVWRKRVASDSILICRADEATISMVFAKVKEQ
jgi:tRNA(His) guanylyltransferase